VKASLPRPGTSSRCLPSCRSFILPLVFSLVSSLALAAGPPARAQQPGQLPAPAGPSPAQTGVELKERLAQALDQREEITQALAATREELGRLDSAIVAGQIEAEELARQEKALHQRLPEVERQMAELAPRVAGLRYRFYRHLRALYLFGADASVTLLASAADFHDALTRAVALTRLLEQERRASRELSEQSALLRDLKAILAYRQNEAEELRRQGRENQQRLARLRDGRLELARELDARGKALEDNVTLLSEAEARLARTFALAPEAEGEGGASGVTRARGRLAPPVEGRYKGRWGPGQRGVLIEARAGAPVRAPWAGTVAHAAALGGFDLVVVLDHGERVHTVLGNLGALAVENGQEVKAGQAVGVLDDAGLLYLEVRRGTRPENPLDWLSISP
jgi:septal ring factor EnvC (AmiA/AmiB activator)